MKGAPGGAWLQAWVSLPRLQSGCPFLRSLAVGINGAVLAIWGHFSFSLAVFSWPGDCEGLETGTVLLWIGLECNDSDLEVSN